MKTITMVTTLTLFGLFGCLKAQEKQLVSVHYFRSGMGIDDSISRTVKKMDDTYICEFKEELMEEVETFIVNKADFNALAEIVLSMKRPILKHNLFTSDKNETLTVVFNRKGKNVTYKYDRKHRLNKKTADQRHQAVELVKRLIDRYRNRNDEIRIYYSKANTGNKVYTHAEPADLVEGLGEFAEHVEPKDDEPTSESNKYSYRWKALKPGFVTIWKDEISLSGSEIPEEFKSYHYYTIDENLNVEYLKTYYLILGVISLNSWEYEKITEIIREVNKSEDLEVPKYAMQVRHFYFVNGSYKRVEEIPLDTSPPIWAYIIDMNAHKVLPNSKETLSKILKSLDMFNNNKLSHEDIIRIISYVIYKGNLITEDYQLIDGAELPEFQREENGVIYTVYTKFSNSPMIPYKPKKCIINIDKNFGITINETVINNFDN